ncbi:MAG TPA: MBG domain-containing protein [Symbiobacteriaceae bacterium]|nr:MBG domain-containing protein [Symbiobacteriaceae bacterium]
MRRWLTLCVMLLLTMALGFPATVRAGGHVSTILTLEPASATYGDGVDAVAVLRDADTDAGIPGKVVNFLVAGQFRSVFTDADGRAAVRGLNPGRLAAGTYPNGVQARFDGRTGYDPSSGAADLTVGRRPLRVIPQSLSREYGDPNPQELPYRIENFAYGESAGVLAALPACTTDATQASPRGTYAIRCAGLEAANYEAEYATGTLTVTPVPMLVRADDQTRPYRGENPTFTATYVGAWKLDEGPGVLTGQLKCTAPAGKQTWAAPGRYEIFCAGQTAENYALKYIPGTLTIVK